jgi:hypothetical protein
MTRDDGVCTSPGKECMEETSVVDPEWFGSDLDPDPTVKIVLDPDPPFEPGQLNNWQILGFYNGTAARLLNYFKDFYRTLYVL